MTPEEARTKWCSEVRIGLVITDSPGARPTVNAVNRYVATTAAGKLVDKGVAQNANCIADDCMKWRWAPKPQADKLNADHAPHGYCGLAGVPAPD